MMKYTIDDDAGNLIQGKQANGNLGEREEEGDRYLLNCCCCLELAIGGEMDVEVMWSSCR